MTHLQHGTYVTLGTTAETERSRSRNHLNEGRVGLAYSAKEWLVHEQHDTSIENLRDATYGVQTY